MADEEQCRRNAELTPALATALAPVIGYDKASELAKRSLNENRTLRELVTEEDLVDADEIDRILDPRAMTEPGVM